MICKKALHLLFFVLIIMAFFTSKSSAQYSAIESFNYAPGTNFDTLAGTTGNGWTGSWDLYDGPKGAAVIADTGFHYNDLNYAVPRTGHQLVCVNQNAWDSHRYGRSLDKVWPDQAGKVYWFSMLMEIQNAPTANCWLGVKLCKDQGSEYMMFGKGWGMTVYTVGSGYHGAADQETSTTNWDVGPVWLVGKIIMSGDSQNEKAYMWITPDPSAEPDTATADAKSNPGMNDGFQYIKIEFGGETVGMEVAFDEIRLGESFADVSSPLVSSGYLARESFEYSKGASIDAGTGGTNDGWGGPWAIDTSNAKNYNLSLVSETAFKYGDLNYNYPHVGNSLEASAPGSWASARYFRPLDKAWPDVQGQYWVSYLFQTEKAPTGNTYYLLKLYSDSKERIAFGKGGGGTTYTCGSGWPGGSGSDVSKITAEGGPIWIVSMINLTGDASKDANAKTYMWINPDPSAAPDTSLADVKRNTDMSTGFNRVAIEFGGADTMKLAYDEIRLGTSFNDVSSPLVTAVEQLNQIPTQFSLSQNYPNPFNPSTNISYTLNKAGIVRLSVYDVLGREIAVLVNEVQGPGSYQIPFIANNLSSGIYFYRLQANSNVMTKKMLLLK